MHGQAHELRQDRKVATAMTSSQCRGVPGHFSFSACARTRCCRSGPDVAKPQLPVNTSLVLTLVGPDRPGLVESVAQIVATHGGNWLESRMARLGGQFAGVARVELDRAREAELTRALAALAGSGLKVAVAADSANAAAPAGVAMRLELVGQDRPGIVRQITGVLAAHRVNVETLDTECVEAPHAGGVLFQAKAELIVPPGADMAAVRRELEKIAADLMVDVSLRETR